MTAHGLECKMTPTKVDGPTHGSKVMADRWYIIHSASGRSICPATFADATEAEAKMAAIYEAIPEADWALGIADLIKIENLQVRVIKA